ncbi:MAG: CCA tRNA nucleotidyltransferase [Alphaproteobacteria bacterium]
MGNAPPSLAERDWLHDPAIRRAFDLLGAAADDTRIVGGAVRDALLGRPVNDIDFATVLRPQQVMDRALAAGIKAVPTGIEFGTVTLVIDQRPIEVTTLRQDVETDGRRAVVRFGHDWLADAQRRDFTINTMSVDQSGRVHDPLGGYDDLESGIVRFVGDPDMRIAEDRLRILRLFRFHASYGHGAMPDDDLAAAVRARRDIVALSAERVGMEMRRLVNAPRAAATTTLMQETGILPIVLAGIGYVRMLARVTAFAAASPAPIDNVLALTALGTRIDEDVKRLAERFRLSRAERFAMGQAVRAAQDLLGASTRHGRRKLLHQHGTQAFLTGAALAYAWSGAADMGAWLAVARVPLDDPVPEFPLSGRDVVALGVPTGRDVGALLSALEAWWIEEGFVPDADALRARLAQMVAGSQ